MTNHGFILLTGGTPINALKEIAREVSDVQYVVKAHACPYPPGVIVSFETGHPGTSTKLRALIENIQACKAVQTHKAGITNIWYGLHSFQKGQPIPEQ